MSQIQVVIDPGHGGADNGASYGYINEDDTNLEIAYYLEYELKEAGVSYIMTREKDEYISLEQRSTLANIKMPKLFVSIHCDAFHKQTASGMSVHVYQHPSWNALRAADCFQKQLTIHFPTHRWRGIRRSDFHVLRETHMPAVLIECEFLSNPETLKFLRKPENKRRMAQCFKRSIVNYLR